MSQRLTTSNVLFVSAIIATLSAAAVSQNFVSVTRFAGRSGSDADSDAGRRSICRNAAAFTKLGP